MPVVNMPVELLLRLVNRDRPIMDEARLPQTLHDMGIEVDELTTTRVFACGRCENVLERTEAQGEPLHCSKCGVDFRAEAAALRALGVSNVARLDMLAVRPDIFDPGGMARYMRGFLGAGGGPPATRVAPAQITVHVDPALSTDACLRPFIACAVLRGVQLDHDTIKLLMNLQEDLHWALGRDRKLASIGVYDLDTLRGTAYRYDAVARDEVRFVPLGFPREAANELTPGEILERHKSGREFAHLLAQHQRVPLLRDEAGTVLSMPPIINSENTRVTRATRNFFIDVTGLSPRCVDRALNIVVSNLLEIMPAAQPEAVQIAPRAAGANDVLTTARATPELRPVMMQLSVAEASETIGVPLTTAELAGLLERMGHSAGPAVVTGERLNVGVPAYRNDILHPIDLIEDAAIAFGYDRLVPELLPAANVGRPRAIEEHSAVVRRIFTGLGFHQVITLTLTSEPASFDRWLLPAGEPSADALRAQAVRIDNPISVEQTICRVSLLPGLLETLAINKQYDLPQQIFEVGDVALVDAAVETGAREERYVAAAMIGTHVGYADIRAVLDAFAHELSRPMTVRAMAHPSYLPGRVGEIVTEGMALGRLGELHPRVLEEYGLRHAVAVLELSLAGWLQLAE